MKLEGYVEKFFNLVFAVSVYDFLRQLAVTKKFTPLTFGKVI